MDSRCYSGLLISCRHDRLSGASSWRGYIYSYTPLAPAAEGEVHPVRIRLATRTAHLWPASATTRDSAMPLARLILRHSSCQAGRRVVPPTLSRNEVSTVQVCCFWLVFPSVTQWGCDRAAEQGRPQFHGTRCRLCRSTTLRPPLSLRRSLGCGVGRQWQPIVAARVLVPCIRPAFPLSPFRLRTGRCRRGNCTDITIPIGPHFFH